MLSTSGCESIKNIKIFTTPVERQPLDLDYPPPPNMIGIKWIIISEENKNEIFKYLKEKGSDEVLFGLTDDSFESLSLNLAQTRKYIILTREMVEQYKNYYEPKKKRKSDDR